MRVVTGKLSLDKAEEQKVFNSFEVRQDQVLAQYKPQFEQVEAQLNNAQVALEELRDTREFEQQKHELHERAGEARAAYLAAFARLEEQDAYSKALQQRALLGFGVVLLLAGAVSLVVGLLRIMPRAVPFYLGAASVVGVCGLLVLGTFVFETPAPDQSPVAALGLKDEPTSQRVEILAEDAAAQRMPGMGGMGAGFGGPPAPPGLLFPARRRAARKGRRRQSAGRQGCGKGPRRPV